MKKIVFSTATGLVIAGTAVTSASASESVEVVKGDTLWSIAATNSTSVQALKKANNLESNIIYPGQDLKIKGSEKVHMVTSGETLYRIALNNGVSVSDLKAWNSLDSNLIYPGQQLKLVAPAAKPAPEPVEEEAAEETPSSDTVHTVSSGDTLYSIAASTGNSVSDLKAWNSLDSNLIYPGQELQLVAPAAPAPEPEPEAAPVEEEPAVEASSSDSVHTVAAGETLYSIAASTGNSVADLKAWNALGSDLIFPGQEIVLYPTEEPEVLPEPVEEEAPAPEVVEEAQTAPEPEVEPEAQEPASDEAAEVAESPTPAAVPEPTNEAPEGDTLTVSATAYTAECYGCSGITATGVNLNEDRNAKVIAVDPDVIPLGTRVYVEGYGEAIAADTGGAINGNKIDLHVPTRSEALEWGVRTVEVTILD